MANGDPKWTELIEPKINVGTIVAMVFLVGTAYTQLKSSIEGLRIELASARIEIQDVRAAYVRADVQAVRDRRTDEKLSELQYTLGRIEKLVK